MIYANMAQFQILRSRCGEGGGHGRGHSRGKECKHPPPWGVLEGSSVLGLTQEEYEASCPRTGACPGPGQGDLPGRRGPTAFC